MGIGARKAFTMFAQHHLEIVENLSCQKTESTIVLAILQSSGKSQVDPATKEEQKTPPKWSSGRACGAASTTQRTRSASLRSHALMDKMEKKKDAQKEPNDLRPKNYLHFQQRCIKNAQKWDRKRD